MRQSTHCKYNNYIKHWLDYSKTIGKIEVTDVLDFLSTMFEKGHAYSTISTAKCAIATMIHIPPYESLNKHPLINKYMTGIFNLRPPKPKLSFVWDVDILYRSFEQQGDNCLLSDIILTQKRIILLLLLGAHSLSTINLFCINNMVLNDLLVTFIPTEVLKHSRKGKPLDKFEYRTYENKTLCVIAFFRRNKHEGLTTDQLIIFHRKPFKGASIDTMRRWIQDIFIVNNIVNYFPPHSCRAASSSKAKRIAVNIDEIIRRGCWKNRKNFFKFCDKEIIEYASEDIDFNRICSANNNL